MSVINYAAMPRFELGYAEALLAHRTGCDITGAWEDIGPESFSSGTLGRIASDCGCFLAAASTIIATAKDHGVELDEFDLGWHYYHQRHATGFGFADGLPFEVSAPLAHIANHFRPTEVGIEDGKIEVVTSPKSVAAALA